MNDLFALFGDNEPTDTSPPAPVMMMDSQRSEIRELFRRLGIEGAREQFDLVHELTGQRITSVAQLEFSSAQTLIHRLRNKSKSQGRPSTGNAWDDRQDDTWIDKL